MKLIYFPGCKIADHLPAYGRSVKAVLTAFGIELVELPLNCCGYPIRDRSPEAAVWCAVRNLALAEARGLDLITPCKCCFGTLRQAAYWMERSRPLKERIGQRLKKEGLSYTGRFHTWHLLSVLTHQVGLEVIGRQIRHPFTKLHVAAHYGCHALRPSDVVQLDNPLAPTIFEDLLSILGATPVSWPRRLECCGQPQKGKNDRVARRLLQSKINDAAAAGATVVATACTYCQMHFESSETQNSLQVLPLSHLMAQAMGLDIDSNQKPPTRSVVADSR